MTNINTSLTLEKIKYYQKKMNVIKENGFKAIDFKELGREVQANHPQLSTQQVIDILNGKTVVILNILLNQEGTSK